MANARRQKKARFVGQDATDPNGFVVLIQRHLADLEALGYAPSGLPDRLRALEHLSVWCVERGLSQPRALLRPHLEQYRRYLSRTGIGANSQAQRLVMVRRFFGWLAKHHYIHSNPAADLECPRVPERLPRYVLSQDEIEALLATADTNTPLGLRDRALMELLYATGLRRQEAANLDTSDLHFRRGVVLVRAGKNQKDRYAPLGERLSLWLKLYLERGRDELDRGVAEHALWLSHTGLRLTAEGVSDIVRRAKQTAGLDVPGAAHLFRHAMATAMLEGGADIRYVQELLGHAKVTTTEIYTHVSLNRLKAIYEATHPAAKLRRSEDSGQ